MCDASTKAYDALFLLAVAAARLEPLARSMQHRHELAVEASADEGILDEEDSHEEALFGADFAAAHTALVNAFLDLPKGLREQVLSASEKAFNLPKNAPPADDEENDDV